MRKLLLMSVTTVGIGSLMGVAFAQPVGSGARRKRVIPKPGRLNAGNC
jgi:hypothetical protein